MTDLSTQTLELVTTPLAIGQVIFLALVVGFLTACMVAQSTPKMRRKHWIFCTVATVLGLFGAAGYMWHHHYSQLVSAHKVWQANFAPHDSNGKFELNKRVQLHGKVKSVEIIDKDSTHVGRRAARIVDDQGRELTALLLLGDHVEHKWLRENDRVKITVEAHPRHLHKHEHWTPNILTVVRR